MQQATPKSEQALCAAISHAAKQVKNSAFFIGIRNSLDRRAYGEALDELELAGKHGSVGADYWQQLKQIAGMLGVAPQARQITQAVRRTRAKLRR